MDMVFLGRSAIAGLRPGTRVTVEGTVTKDEGRPVVWNAAYRIESTRDCDGQT
jgi:hypothetical protein